MKLLGYVKKARHAKLPAKQRVTLLYCTCNDFEANSLEWSMKQDYDSKLLKTVILDDSTDPDYKAKVDEFAKQHKGVKVIRRKDRKGFKAGNINNYLRWGGEEGLRLLCNLG